MTRDDAIRILIECLCGAPKRVAHSIAVAGYAREVAEGLRGRGESIDVDQVEIIGLLHDIGHGLLALGGSIEEHALVELAWLQSRGESRLGYGVASDFATHEGLDYTLRQGDAATMTLPANPAHAARLREAGLPIDDEGTIRYESLLECVRLPDGEKRLADHLEEAIEQRIFVPTTIEDCVVTFADVHLQQGQPARDDAPPHQETELLVMLPADATGADVPRRWSVAYGSFVARIADIEHRFSRSDDPGHRKILACVRASRDRIQSVITDIHRRLHADPSTPILPERTSYDLAGSTP